MNTSEIEAELVPDQTQALTVRQETGAVGILRPADSLDRIADAFKEYQRVCERILTRDDYQEYEGKPRKKKSAWRKLATAFNVSTRVVEKEIERDDSRNVVSAFFTIEASAGNRNTNGSGYCEVTEKCCPTRLGNKCRKAAWKGHFCCENGCDGRKHWSHANHDIIATAETRAKNRAIADLIGCGEVSAEELVDEEPKHTAPKEAATPAPKPASKPAPKPSAPVPFPTPESRQKMIAALKAGPGQQNRQRATEYFKCLRDPSQLMPHEEIEQLPLRFVPATVGQMKDLVEAIGRFDSGDPAVAAFPPHPEPETPQEPDHETVDHSDMEQVTGTIQHVSQKQGTSKKGPWILYGIKICDGWINTFSDRVGALAQQNQGKKVTVWYKTEEKGRTAYDLEVSP